MIVRTGQTLPADSGPPRRRREPGVGPRLPARRGAPREEGGPDCAAVSGRRAAVQTERVTAGGGGSALIARVRAAATGGASRVQPAAAGSAAAGLSYKGAGSVG